MNRKLVTMSIIALAITTFLGVTTGSSNINISDVFNIIMHKVLGTDLHSEIKTAEVSIIWVLRVPRVFLALLVGASLAVSGSSTQSVLKNPLASPYTLGVSTGASFGAVLVIITGFHSSILGYFTLATAGFIFGLITIFIILAFTKKVDNAMSNQTIILVGMVFSLFVNAVIAMVAALATRELQQIVLWQMGSFSLRGWKYVYAIIPFFIIGFLGTMMYTRELDALSFGEEQAMTIGVDVIKVKKRLIVFSAILAGSAVAVSGVIGFVGLVAPHIVRKIFGPKHSILIPMSAVFGGMFMVLMDLVARTVIAPVEIPVGAITALIGAPFFAFIFFSRRKQ